jgi:hypothetical protein
VGYALVIFWALAGIAVKHAGVPSVAVPTWIVFGLVAVTLGAAFFLGQPRHKLAGQR